MHTPLRTTLMTQDSPAAETDPSDGVPSAAEERHRQLEFQRRQLFSQAQEKFASADFDGARRCLEEIALDQGFVSAEEMQDLVNRMPNSTYRDYVVRVLEEHRSPA